MNERILLNTLAKVLEVEPEVVYNMDYDCSLENYGLESLSLIKLLVEIEREFKIEIADSDLLEFSNCTISFLIKKLKEYDVKFENAPFLLNDELDIYLDENGDEY